MWSRPISALRPAGGFFRAQSSAARASRSVPSSGCRTFGIHRSSDRLDEHDMIVVLNAYFERLAGAVMAHDGEVLKFIGDGLLAVFPYAAFGGEREAALASLAAAEEAVE